VNPWTNIMLSSYQSMQQTLCSKAYSKDGTSGLTTTVKPVGGIN
jgi:hypothetical protein